MLIIKLYPLSYSKIKKRINIQFNAESILFEIKSKVGIKEIQNNC